MKKEKGVTHYSRSGYDGNYHYTSVCGKQIHTHNDKDEVNIRPETTTCKDCMATKEFLMDFGEYNETAIGTKRRIYIESDILQADEFRSARRTARDWAEKRGENFVERGFSDALDHAWHDLEKTWKAVKKADEIWATSSLMPLCNDYMGAPVIFNGMCERAIKENISGKLVILLTHLKYVNWYMIDVKLMKEAFKTNDLIMYNDEYELEKIGVQNLKIKK